MFITRIDSNKNLGTSIPYFRYYLRMTGIILAYKLPSTTQLAY